MTHGRGRSRPRPRVLGRRRARLAALALALLAAAGCPSSGVYVVPPEGESDPIAALDDLALLLSDTDTSAAEPLRVAVLPFASTEGKAGTFGKFVAEHLAVRLVELAAGRWEIVERSRLDAIVGEREDFDLEDLDTVAERLKVTHVLTGTYLRVGNAASVHARLVNALSGGSVVGVAVSVPLNRATRELFAGPAAAPHPITGSLQVLSGPGRAADLAVELWVDRGEGATYRIGDPVTVSFRTSEDAYVTVLDFQTGGEVYTLFPNCFSPAARVRAGTVVSIPAAEDGYEIEVTGPAGIERLKAVASLRPHEVSEPPICEQEAFEEIAPGEVEAMERLRRRFEALPEGERASANTYLRVQ